MSTICFGAFGSSSGKPIPAGGGPLTVLKVPDGMWAVFAKMNVDNDSASVHTLDCKLKAGGKTIDENLIRTEASGLQKADNVEVTFMGTAYFPGTSDQKENAITLECAKDSGSANVAFRLNKIMAIKLDFMWMIPG